MDVGSGVDVDEWGFIWVSFIEVFVIVVSCPSHDWFRVLLC